MFNLITISLAPFNLFAFIDLISRMIRSLQITINRCLIKDKMRLQILE